MIDAKKALRNEMKASRAAVPDAVRTAGATQVADHAVRMLRDLPGVETSAFLSIGDELDTGPLIAALASAGHPVGLPVTQGKGQPLIFRTYSPGDELATVMWGIREPLPSSRPLTPRVLFVPLLAFDRQGYRLGYGGGFYDRTLQLLRQAGPVTAIGIGFPSQEVDAVPHLDYDERLDWVLVPSGPIACAA